MRKYLLASAALLGLAAGGAQAATFDQTDAKRNASAFGAPQTNPDPGKIIVHMGGLVAVDFGLIGNTSDKSNVNGAKLQPYGIAGYFRLYFGVDGKLANGLIYGAKSEMRTNFAGSPPQGYALAAGNAGYGGPSGNSTASLWYTRRAYGYIGGDAWGVVRVGAGDGPLSQFTGGGITTGEAYDTGQWDGDVCDFIGANCLSWAFYDVGNEYDSAKIAWVSPKWSGLQVGFSFAPSSASLTGVDGNLANGGSSARQSTSATASDVQRIRNIWELAARWQGNLGPVAVDVMGGYIGSGIVNATAAALLPAGTTKVNGLSVFDFGASLTMSGFSVFGHVTGGKMNGQAGTPLVNLASGRKKEEIAFIVGAQWTGGPWTAGLSYYSVDRQGSNLPVGTGAATIGNRTERAFDIGGQYTVTPGFDLFLEYIYGQIKQSGVNFRDGAAGLAVNDNKSTSNAVLFTTLFRW